MSDCGKDRLIELMHDFVLFDGGVKKLPRVHQYFGIQAAQRHVEQRKGGIIWHTQASAQDIAKVEGIARKLADEIYRASH